MGGMYSDPVLALRADLAVQAKNMGQGLVMSGRIKSQPGGNELLVHEQQREPSWQPV